MSNQQEVVTPEAVEAAAEKLYLRVSAYMSKLAEIVEGDDDSGQHERALEWREEVYEALEAVDELRARMAQAREDRDEEEEVLK